MTKNGKILAFPDMAALDAEAAGWVARFDAGDVSAKDQAEFQAWLNSSALHRQAIAEYGSFWAEFDQLGQLTNPVGAGQEVDVQPRRSLTGAKYWLVGCAAAVLVMVAAGGVVRQQIPDRPSVQQAAAPRLPVRQSYATAVGGQKKFTLADGSVVALNTNSQINVEILGDRRDIHLVRGEAYFEVVHDKTRPFTVYADQYVVRDIGTAFAVHLLDKCLVNVRVTKGSVEIAARRTRKGKVSDKAKSLGVVVAGHDVVFGQRIERAEVVSDAELGRKLAWRQGQLIYSGQPLAEVLADIGRYSDIQIELADPALRDLPVGGAFSVNQTDAIFAALQNNFGVHAEWIDARHVRLTSVRGKDTAGN